MEAQFWLERWGRHQTPWDQPAVHPMLVEHWNRHIGDGAVFVPLCGKSVDMAWLAQQGHRVVGSELSPVAVAEFLAERGLTADQRTVGDLTVHAAADFELWCGDFFDLPPAALDGVTAVYDRASLVALPPALRRRYADHLGTIAPAEVTIFLIAFEYDDGEMGGPPFSVTRDEVADLYGDAFEIDVVVDDDVLARNGDMAARGLTRLRETLTVMRRGG
jgi:thiopurine S-methyltransferase